MKSWGGMTVDYKNMETDKIIDLLCDLDERKDNLASQISIAQAELQARGLQILEDKNIKSTEFYGNRNNFATVTLAQSLDVLNYDKLCGLLGKELVNEKVKRKEEVKYTLTDHFKKAVMACFMGDYESDITIETLLYREFPELTRQQIALLLKKLKGDYKKDKKTLQTVVSKQDIDSELYCICQIKNYEAILAYIDADKVMETTEKLRQCILVDETPKIAVKFEKGA